MVGCKLVLLLLVGFVSLVEFTPFTYFLCIHF
ncbi:UNVERIFIED_CONTAM: hypothetical protein NCL1_14536 [Trichonephila clavipes]